MESVNNFFFNFRDTASDHMNKKIPLAPEWLDLALKTPKSYSSWSMSLKTFFLFHRVRQLWFIVIKNIVYNLRINLCTCKFLYHVHSTLRNPSCDYGAPAMKNQGSAANLVRFLWIGDMRYKFLFKYSVIRKPVTLSILYKNPKRVRMSFSIW